MSDLTDDERTERRIVWLIAAAIITPAVVAISILGITAWVIIRVTLHFT